MSKGYAALAQYAALAEPDEDQIWEAAMTASVYKLDNPTAILDNNGLMATGPIALRFDAGPLAEKWRAITTDA